MIDGKERVGMSWEEYKASKVIKLPTKEVPKGVRQFENGVLEYERDILQISEYIYKFMGDSDLSSDCDISIDQQNISFDVYGEYNDGVRGYRPQAERIYRFFNDKDSAMQFLSKLMMMSPRTFVYLMDTEHLA